jgi:predicted acyl esterase
VWLGHQRRDAYWQRGSVCEDLGQIACPVYAVGGWADAYSNAIPRLLAGLRTPRKGLIGPWGHRYAHAGVPGPAIGFLQEARRWWDHWLRGVDDGVMDEPRYRVWMQERRELAGRWVAEDGWPSARIATQRWPLGPGRLGGPAAPSVALACRSPESVGLAAGDWCSFGGEGETPADQGEDDAASLTFDSAPLAEPLEILGAPVALLELAVDRPAAFVAVRLNELSPDGASTRVTYGVLNLTHRAGHERPEPLEPGRRYTVRVALNDVAHAFAAGSRLRLAISTAYWPVVWPSPEPVTLTLWTGGSALELPVRPVRAEDTRLRAFEEPEGAAPPAYTVLRPPRVERTVARDAASGEVVHTLVAEGGRGRIDEIDLELEQSTLRRYRIRADDPRSARAEVVHRAAMRRGAWAVRVEGRAVLTATRREFRVEASLRAFEGETLVRERRWEETLTREGV